MPVAKVSAPLSRSHGVLELGVTSDHTGEPNRLQVEAEKL